MLKSTGSLRPYRTHWRMLYRDFLQWDSTEAASRSRGPASMHVKAMPCHAAQAPAAQLKPVCISWSQSCFAWSDPSHMPVRLYATFVFSDVNNKPRHPHKQEMLRKKNRICTRVIPKPPRSGGRIGLTCLQTLSFKLQPYSPDRPPVLDKTYRCRYLNEAEFGWRSSLFSLIFQTSIIWSADEKMSDFKSEK